MKPALPVTSQRSGFAVKRWRTLSIAVIAASASEPPHRDAVAVEIAGIELALHVGDDRLRQQPLEIVGGRAGP